MKSRGHVLGWDGRKESPTSLGPPKLGEDSSLPVFLTLGLVESPSN